MKKLKNLICIILSVCFMGVFIACDSASGSGKITLTVWDDETNIEMLETLVEEFTADYKKQYPFASELEIVLVPQSEQSAVEKLELSGPAGNGPDIFAFVHDTLGTAVNSGLIAKNQYSEVVSLTHSSAAVAAFSMKGEIYGYPITSESLTVMYDKSKITAEELASFSALKASDKKIAWEINKQGYYPFGLFTDSVLFGASGTEDSNINLATTKTVDNLYSVMTDYKANITSTDPDTALALLQSGEVAGLISSPYIWDSVKKALGANAAIAVLPEINGEVQRPFSGYKGYGVSRFSNNPSVAHAFAAFLTNAENQLYRFVKKGYLPTIESDSLNAAVAKDAVATAFKQSLNNSITMPNILKMGKYWAPVEDAMAAIWKKDDITKDFISQQLTTATNTIKGN